MERWHPQDVDTPGQRHEPHSGAEGGSSPEVRYRGYSNYTPANTLPAATNGIEGDAEPAWPSTALDPGSAQCTLCAARGVSRDLLIKPRPGDTWQWRSSMSVCTDCAALLEQGQDAALGARLNNGGFDDPNEPDPIARARHLGQRLRAVRASPPARPDVAALITARFMPLENYTGVTAELGPLWPTGHSRSLPEFRADAWDTTQPIWFIRSPWPKLTVDDVLTALWPWVEQDRVTLEQPAWRARVLQAFSWTQTDALTALGAARHRQ